MAYDSYLPNNWWGSKPPVSNSPQDRVRRFDERGDAPTGAAAPTETGNAGIPQLPDYSQIGNIINQINAQGQQAQINANNARIPFQPQLENQSSQFIANLYGDANRAPGEMFANISTNAAERAVAGGYAGSAFAGVSGLRMNEEERLRRGMMAGQAHSGAIARNPGYNPADPMALVLQRSQQAYGAQQGQLSRDLQERIVNAQMANAALRERRSGSSGGGGYGPQLPTQYGRPTGSGAVESPGSRTNIPEDPNRFGPYQLAPLPPNVSNLDNWSQLNTWQKDDYFGAIGNNPYYGMPDWQNPYSGDANPTNQMQYDPNWDY